MKKRKKEHVIKSEKIKRADVEDLIIKRLLDKTKRKVERIDI